MIIANLILSSPVKPLVDSVIVIHALFLNNHACDISTEIK